MSIRERLENLRWRIGVWWFTLRSSEATITRSCGHIETGRVLSEWIEGRKATPCPECVFREALERMAYVSGMRR